MTDHLVKDYQTLAEIQRDLSADVLTYSTLADSYLSRIAARPELNAFIEVYEEEARAAAAGLDQQHREGKAGPLAGLFLGVKDVICHTGHEVSASSKILKGFRSLITSTALQRLTDAGAIVIGRQGCDEFAMGSSSESSCYGPVRNPHDLSRVPGGSSGASAASVAANFCHAAIGSDTGGSVRQPASFCGVVGFKPSYGRVSRWGLIAYASSFDQIGPITRSVEDSARMLQVMAGHDPHDNTSSPRPVPDYLSKHSGRTYTIGYIREAIESPGLDPHVRATVLESMDRIREAGHHLKEVHFPYLDHVVPCYYVLTTAEASSNLSRFDGVRYGYRSPSPETLEELYVRSRTEGFGPEVKKRIMLGSFVLSAGYYDAYYNQAMKVRRLIRTHTEQLLEECDFLLTPTSPSPAFKLGEKSDDPIAMFLSDIYTVHANLAGVPAISLPMGKSPEGLPIGVQLMGRHFEEDRLFAFSRNLTQEI